MIRKTLSNRLLFKLSFAFLAILLLAGLAYTALSVYWANHFFYESNQRLHANLAQDLIDEKFVDQSPFQEDGTPNKALFGDIMHDMMAVNRAIEVYLLDEAGKVQYSVVLDHDAANETPRQVALGPIESFIASNGQNYILGDDPRDPTKKKTFSAARFNKNDKEGYIYIILAGEEFIATRSTLLGSYFGNLGLGGSILTLVFTGLLGIVSIWFLTKNLREIVFAAKRFEEGDWHYRIQGAEKMDLAGVAVTYNQMAETILSDMQKIKSLENLRTELIANISHDLRTPLSIIQGYIETLQIKDGELEREERKAYLSTVRKSSERLGKLITQLFEYSKLEANQIVPKKEPFLINDLVSDIQQEYSLLAKEKDIQLELSLDDSAPQVFADISLVERAIQNLLENALKFTPNNGKVILEIRSEKQQVEITIRDNGPGIEPAHQELIFERYRRTDNAAAKEGSGLGLAIVKKIIEIHNSRIEVLSIPDKGTSFRFRLPVYAHSMA